MDYLRCVGVIDQEEPARAHIEQIAARRVDLEQTRSVAWSYPGGFKRSTQHLGNDQHIARGG